MRFIKVPKEGINIEHLYVNITCAHCRRDYGVHIRRFEHHKTCPCGFAAFDITLRQYGRWLGFAVVWTGRVGEEFEVIREIDVNTIEVAQVEVPWYEEIEPEEGE